MSRLTLTGARILADGQLRQGQALVLAGGLIEAILPESALPFDAQREDLGGGTLIPGFVDSQVNGGGGALLNDAPDLEGVQRIAAAHLQFGTTAFLPTLISDDLSVVATAIQAVDEAMAQGVPSVIGIHIEGPFLNAGKRGIHDDAKFRTLDAEAVSLLSSLQNGKTLVTLAPELAPPGMIRALVDRGVIVAAGHSLAHYDDMQRAMDEGLTGVTHLFNAMSQMESREPGVVGTALDTGLMCGIIVDGHHVDAASLRAAYRAKSADELMLVTDAMPLVGTGQTHFQLSGREILARGGALRSADGTLAGSMLDMAMALRNAMSLMRVDLAKASTMASGTPARFLGLGGSHGRIASGYRADLVLLDDALSVRKVWIGGMSVSGD